MSPGHHNSRSTRVTGKEAEAMFKSSQFTWTADLPESWERWENRCSNTLMSPGHRWGLTRTTDLAWSQQRWKKGMMPSFSDVTGTPTWRNHENRHTLKPTEVDGAMPSFSNITCTQTWCNHSNVLFFPSHHTHTTWTHTHTTWTHTHTHTHTTWTHTHTHTAWAHTSEM